MHSVTKSMQQGFTLIELMIVVAIIAILAAIAVPQYEHYIARAQFSEALTVPAALQTDVVNFWDQNGELATGVAEGTTPSGNEIPIPTTMTGKYVNSVSLTSGVITVTFNSGGVSKALQTGKVSLTPGTFAAGAKGAAGAFTALVDGTAADGNITWQCGTNVTELQDVPAICRNAFNGG